LSEIDSSAKRRMLGSSFVFSSLPAALLEELAGVCRLRKVERQAFVFHMGDEGDALFGVVQGLIRIWVPGTRGRELTLTLMEPGDIFGEIALLDGLERTANATAVVDSTLLVLDRSVFLKVLEREPSLSRHIIELLCEKLRGETTRIAEDAFFDLRVRLAKRLLSLLIGYGEPAKEGGELTLKMSQEELGNMLGVSREAINKQLSGWVRGGLIAVKHGKITLLDREALKKEAAPSLE
jgi:CRP-like cAMP-binding protein